jgi:uncharacterized coiled-coil protein SlyX
MNTNEELFDDLKQFISATVSQSEARLSGRMDSLENRIDGVESRMTTKEDLMAVEQRLSRKIDDVQAAIGDAIQEGNEATDKRVDDHEQRLRRLEHRTA